LDQQPVPAPIFCVPHTSIDAVIDLMNEKQGENGIWVINENKVSNGGRTKVPSSSGRKELTLCVPRLQVPLEMLHCTDLIRFLLLKEKKQREELEEKEEKLEWKRHSKFETHHNTGRRLSNTELIYNVSGITLIQ